MYTEECLTMLFAFLMVEKTTKSLGDQLAEAILLQKLNSYEQPFKSTHGLSHSPLNMLPINLCISVVKGIGNTPQLRTQQLIRIH